jgi:hypothetical protein
MVTHAACHSVLLSGGESNIYIKEENFDANAIVISKLQGPNIMT